MEKELDRKGRIPHILAGSAFAVYVIWLFWVGEFDYFQLPVSAVLLLLYLTRERRKSGRSVLYTCALAVLLLLDTLSNFMNYMRVQGVLSDVLYSPYYYSGFVRYDAGDVCMIVYYASMLVLAVESLFRRKLFSRAASVTMTGALAVYAVLDYIDVPAFPAFPLKFLPSILLSSSVMFLNLFGLLPGYGQRRAAGG